MFAQADQQQATHAADARQSPDAAPARLLPLQANLTQAFPVVAANADGSDLWPCLGRTAGNPAGWSSSADGGTVSATVCRSRTSRFSAAVWR